MGVLSLKERASYSPNLFKNYSDCAISATFCRAAPRYCCFEFVRYIRVPASSLIETHTSSAEPSDRTINEYCVCDRAKPHDVLHGPANRLRQGCGGQEAGHYVRKTALNSGK